MWWLKLSARAGDQLIDVQDSGLSAAEGGRPDFQSFSPCENERVILPSRARGLLTAIVIATAAGGSLAALYYHRLGLTLSHYDARGHLVVARRIIDNITPGWQQIGAVWLPLPHLLNALPVQIDAFYRSGASAVALSTLSFGVAAAAIGWLVMLLTESPAAALASATVFALNPNMVYLQATPMTEPLMLALTTLGVAMLLAWSNRVTAAAGLTPLPAGTSIGVVFALACLTRYEAWPVTYAALAAAAWTLWRRGEPLGRACRRIAGVALYPTAAIVAFAIFSRVVIGAWFVSSGFFVPENKAHGLPLEATAEILWGTAAVSGPAMLWLAAAGGAALLATALTSRLRAGSLVGVSLVTTAAVPWVAFVEGHPFRVRYMVPLIAAEAVAIGALVGLAAVIARRYRPALRRVDVVAAVVVLCAAALTVHPLDATAPMVVEAQWDRPNVPARQHVTNCLRARYDGTSIMASMGSLGHYMQEAARDGFRVRDFLHEGNGDIWLAAIEAPKPYAGWLLIEEKAQGGDVLAKRAREYPHFLDGYSRLCEGAGMALYERQNRMLNVKR